MFGMTCRDFQVPVIVLPWQPYIFQQQLHNSILVANYDKIPKGFMHTGRITQHGKQRVKIKLMTSVSV